MMGISSESQQTLFSSARTNDHSAPKVDSNSLIESYPAVVRLCSVLKMASESNKGNPFSLQIKPQAPQKSIEFYVDTTSIRSFFNMLRNNIQAIDLLVQNEPSIEVRLPFFKVAQEKKSSSNELVSSTLVFTKDKIALISIESPQGALKLNPVQCGISKSNWNQLYAKAKNIVGHGIPETHPAHKNQNGQTTSHENTINAEGKTLPAKAPTVEGIAPDEMAYLARELL